MLNTAIVCWLQSARYSISITLDFQAENGIFLVHVADSLRYVTNNVWEDHHGASLHADSVSGKSDPGSLSV